jgi:hypothetical protein
MTGATFSMSFKKFFDSFHLIKLLADDESLQNLADVTVNNKNVELDW